MTAAQARGARSRPSRSVLGWVTDSAPVARLRQAGRPIPAEDFVENGVYVIRADLPGVDPARDIDLLVRAGTIEIRAIRRDDLKNRRHADISYGLFRRVMRIPADADSDSLTTRYTNGVLEVAMELPGARPTPIRSVGGR